MRPSMLVLAISIAGLPLTLDAARPVQQSTYKVRKGDNAAKIAKRFGLSLDKLEGLNPDFDLARLSVGARLKIKAEPQAKTARIAKAPKLPALRTPTRPAEALPTLPESRQTALAHLERVLPAVVRPLEAHRAEVPSEGSLPLAAQVKPVVPALETPDPRPAPAVDPENLDLLWPLETRSVSSAFGPRTRTRVAVVKTKKGKRRIRQPYTGTHRGIDLTAPVGHAIFASHDGTVCQVGRDKLLGNFVKLDHGNGVETVYGHNRVNLVKVGDEVRRGQKIAEVGMTGRTTGPHVHFEVRIRGNQVNPFPLLNDTEEITAEVLALNETIRTPKGRR